MALNFNSSIKPYSAHLWSIRCFYYMLSISHGSSKIVQSETCPQGRDKTDHMIRFVTGLSNCPSKSTVPHSGLGKKASLTGIFRHKWGKIVTCECPMYNKISSSDMFTAHTYYKIWQLTLYHGKHKQKLFSLIIRSKWHIFWLFYWPTWPSCLGQNEGQLIYLEGVFLLEVIDSLNNAARIYIVLTQWTGPHFVTRELIYSFLKTIRVILRLNCRYYFPIVDLR